MWVKKSEREILNSEFNEQEKFEKTRVKKSFKYAIWMFVGYFSLTSISYVLFGVPIVGHNANNRVDWVDLPKYIYKILSTSTFLALVTFVFNFYFGKKVKSATLMCDKCHLTMNFSDNRNCECGGKFDYLENFKWVDDK